MIARIALTLSAVACTVSFGAVGYTAVTKGETIDQIQAQRVANTRSACEDKNAANIRIRDTFYDVIPGKETAKQKVVIGKLADAISPTMNCTLYVKQKTSLK